MDGWMGRMLEVDLGKRAFRDRELDPELLTRWLGGRGLGVKLLFDSALGVEPLHPSNPLIFAVGPLTGTPVPTAGRFSLVSRSPLTGTVFDCNSGGRWGVALKRCGLDVLMVTGRSPEPVYLEVSEEGARLHPAGRTPGPGWRPLVRQVRTVA